MFLVGFTGCSVGADHWIGRAIKEDHLGGVILFDRNIDGSVQNIRSPEQLRTLTDSLQELAEIPLLVAVDQEGGQVCRLKERDGFPATVSAAELGRLDSIQATAEHAGRIARMLRASGINFNLAPVVDLDLNPENPIIARFGRSFGASARNVIAHAAAFVRAHHRQNIGCCLKHFPGHGSAGLDSHLGFVDITGCWQEDELKPFAGLIQAGLADGIMTAHLVHRGLDEDGLPATLSPRILQAILRGRLHHDGLIVSDDLQMRAITDGWSYGEAVERAVLAGVDLLVVGNNLHRDRTVVRQGIAAIEGLLAQGRIGRSTLQKRLERIQRLKARITGRIPWADGADRQGSGGKPLDMP